MTQAVDVISDPNATTWPHPYDGLLLTLDWVSALGGGSADGGGGGALGLLTTPNAVANDINITVGGKGSADGESFATASTWDSVDTASPRGAPSVGAIGGDSGDCSGDARFSGGDSSGSAGGGAAGAAHNGFNAVTTTGGAGGTNGSYPASLHGGKGGDSGQPGAAPGAGGAPGQDGADGRIAVAYTLVNASVGGDFGTGSTGSKTVASGFTNDPIGTINLSGNPIPGLTITGGVDADAFTLNDLGDGTAFSLAFVDDSPHADGNYVVELTASGSTDFVQTETVTVGSGGHSPPALVGGRLLNTPLLNSLVH